MYVSDNLLVDSVQAIGWFFLNPLFLVALLSAVALGYVRVKRERRSFNVRLLPGLTELRRIVADSWGYAVLLSIIFCGLGLVVPVSWIWMFSALSVLVLLTFYYQLASPIYIAASAVGALYVWQKIAGEIKVGSWLFSSIDFLGEAIITIPIIAGILLIVEGLLIKRSAPKYPSPYLTHTKRGLRAGVFKAKQLWLLPVLFVVPGEMIASYAPYWPQFTLGAASFAVIPTPLVFGYSQIIRSKFPEVHLAEAGRAIVFLGIVVAGVGVAAMWLPILGWTALFIGVVCRAVISIVMAVKERSKGYLLAPSTSGVMIVGILPNSPGEKLGLQPGECIKAVNGVRVQNEKELYDAIQINAAHCRLQIIGRDGEVRLMQQVLYRHDHFRLGLLVVR